MLYDGLLL